MFDTCLSNPHGSYHCYHSNGFYQQLSWPPTTSNRKCCWCGAGEKPAHGPHAPDNNFTITYGPISGSHGGIGSAG